MEEVFVSGNGCFAIAAAAIAVMYLGHEFFKTVNNGIEHGYSMNATLNDYGSMQFIRVNDAYLQRQLQRQLLLGDE